MSNINKIACAVYTAAGGVGTCTFYCPEAEDITGPLNTFFASMTARMPTPYGVTVPDNGETLDAATGAVVGVWSGGTTAGHVGVGAGGFVASAGGSIRWNTAGFVNSRHLHGRTFIVPLAGDQYNTVGNLLDATVTALKGFGDVLISDAAGKLLVWHRPKLHVGGVTWPVLSCTVTARNATLNSRKR